MKTIIILTFVTALFTNIAIAKSHANGEVETDCPWSKQDDRSSLKDVKEAAIKGAAAQKKKVKGQHQ